MTAILFALALCLPLLAQASDPEPYTIADLGTLTAGDSAGASVAYGINNRGQVVGNASISNGQIRAFRSSANRPINPNTDNLGVLSNGTFSEAWKVNKNGAAVGNYLDSSNRRHGFLYTTAMFNLGGAGAYAYGIDSSNNVVGRVFNSSTGELYAFVWMYNGTVIRPCGTYPNGLYKTSTAYDINESGQIVGYFAPNSALTDQHAFRYSTSTGLQDKGLLLGYNNTIPRDISENGDFCGYAFNTAASARRAFVYTGSNMIDLGTLYRDPNNFLGNSQAYGINDRGQVVGYSNYNSTSATHACLWTPLGNGEYLAIDLQDVLPEDSGWTLLQAYGINNLGQIVGTGVNPSGQTRAFRLDPPLHGVDASTMTVDWVAVLNYFNNAPYIGGPPSYVIADAWGGRSAFRAQEILSAAANTLGSDILKAAYCLLNFHNRAPILGQYFGEGPGTYTYAGGWAAYQTGGWQIRQAMKTVGTQLPNLGFMAVDVEADGGTPAPNVSPIQRVGEAVQEVLLNGLTPMIYTRNQPATARHWSLYTGNTTFFNSFPLWDLRYSADGSDDSLANDFGQPWSPYGGWETRSGRQYADQNLSGVGVDLNVFSADVFSRTYAPPPAVEVTASVQITRSPAQFGHPLKNGTFPGSFKVAMTNAGASNILGPIQVVIGNLPNVTPVYASRSYQDMPVLNALLPSKYLFIQYPGGAGYTGPEALLVPGQSITLTIPFSSTVRTLPTYTVNVYSGYFAPGQ